eukprot:156801-Prorocentrum_minimum.AAC.1
MLEWSTPSPPPLRNTEPQYRVKEAFFRFVSFVFSLCFRSVPAAACARGRRGGRRWGTWGWRAAPATTGGARARGETPQAPRSRPAHNAPPPATRRSAGAA